ncbi:biotin-independent malonate decarboxylase subunit beta [Chondromyces crocatus]
MSRPDEARHEPLTPPRPLFLARQSVVEMTARQRAHALLDPGSFRELLDPFERLESPWLARQGIVPQSDDGVVIARGTFGGEQAVVAAIESAFQGGSMGEVSAMKIACALDLARADHEAGRPVRPILFLETGGVRLQEANLGLGIIAEIHAALVALRRLTPVVGILAGPVGCFGGMSLAAALCSHLIVTREARLGMNGPEVIEQEAGIDELDASDRRLVWSLLGGEQRYATGLADALVDDDLDAVKRAVHKAFAHPRGPGHHRTEQIDLYLERLAPLDPSADLTGPTLRTLWPREDDHG